MTTWTLHRLVAAIIVTACGVTAHAASVAAAG